jgi:uncharacterized protein YutD
MKKVVLNNKEYEVVRDDDVFDLETVKELVTDYYDDFDYIFGDQAYNKIRLKGFYESNNKKVKALNDIKNLDDYIVNYCAYGCKVFLLKKIK